MAKRHPVIKYLLNILIALDQLGTVLVGGHPDETMSSYAHRLRTLGKPWGFTADWIDAVFRVVFRQENHCYKAYLEERANLGDNIWKLDR